MYRVYRGEFTSIPLTIKFKTNFFLLFSCLKREQEVSAGDFLIYTSLAREQPPRFTPACARSAKRSRVSNILKSFKCEEMVSKAL